jgi:hypothetical protein
MEIGQLENENADPISTHSGICAFLSGKFDHLGSLLNLR